MQKEKGLVKDHGAQTTDDTARRGLVLTATSDYLRCADPVSAMETKT